MFVFVNRIKRNLDVIFKFLNVILKFISNFFLLIFNLYFIIDLYIGNYMLYVNF